MGVSRKEQDIESWISRWTTPDSMVEISENSTNKDIQAFVQYQVRMGDTLKIWESYPKLQEEIETTLIEKAGGMFRWVECQLVALKNCLDPSGLRQALASLPKTLDETYARIIRNIPSEWTEKAIRLLQLLLYSDTPITIEAAVDAVAVNLSAKPHFEPENRIPMPKLLLRICSSLVSAIVIADSDTGDREILQLAHFSVKEYLKSSRAEQMIQHNISEIPARTSIVRTCLEYISVVGKMPFHDIEMAFPLARYASEWHFHIKVSEVEVAVQSRILDFLLKEEEAYRTWNRILGTTKETPSPSQAQSTLVSANPLFHSSAAGLNSIVESLIQKGADCNEIATNSWSPLQTAATHGHEKTVHLLLRHLTDPKATLAEHPLILESAVISNNESVVKVLLEYQADPNTSSISGGTLLGQAALFGYEGIARLLLEYNADPNAGEDGSLLFGSTLECAVRSENKEIIRLFLEHSLNLNEKQNSGDAALDYAINNKNEQLVESLLELGADANQSPQMADSMLGLACSTGNRSKKIIRLLLDHGADPNGNVRTGLSALSQCVEERDEQVVRLLLQYHADPNAQSAKASLYRAVVLGEEELVRLLLEHNADPNADMQGTPTLWVAVLSGKENIIRLLLQHKADPNLSWCGMPILAESVSKEKKMIVSLLLQFGADPNTKMGDFSVVKMAENGNQLDIVQLLVEYGALQA